MKGTLILQTDVHLTWVKWSEKHFRDLENKKTIFLRGTMVALVLDV